MPRTFVLFLSIAVTAAAPLAAQRRGAGGGGSVTFAISVVDPSGAPVPDVKVTMSGAAERSGRTEAGRLVFENLPAGTYRFRFERDGFVPFEKELAARGSAPIDVKVTLTPAPPPPKPIELVAPPPPPRPAADARPVVLDMPAFIEKNYVGRANGKTTPLGCSTGGSSTLIQINDAIATHAHPDADEFIYVIAGEGSANMSGRQEPLGAGVFMMIPRGLAHGFTTGKKKPLVMMSIRAGGACAG
ncbi:MAG TPA: cupin domain-containing protein [Vicinamibacterales bacterium]|nr:cupin domain-containing protein [Vicinamibacterales bacterium]